MRQRAADNSGLMTVARSVGSTLGVVVRTAGDVADDLRQLKTTLSPGEIRLRLAAARKSADVVAMRGVATKERLVSGRHNATSQATTRRSSGSAKATRSVMKRPKSKGPTKDR